MNVRVYNSYSLTDEDGKDIITASYSLNINTTKLRVLVMMLIAWCKSLTVNYERDNVAGMTQDESIGWLVEQIFPNADEEDDCGCMGDPDPLDDDDEDDDPGNDDPGLGDCDGDTPKSRPVKPIGYDKECNCYQCTAYRKSANPNNLDEDQIFGASTVH